MATQELQWLAIPYDVEKRDGKTFLSVAVTVAPRLQEVTNADKVLSDYPDFVDWPATMKDVAVTINIDGKTITPTDYTVKDEKPNSEAWRALFVKTTLVKPFQYVPFTDFKIFSYPVKSVHDTTHKTYQTFAKEYIDSSPNIESVLQNPNLDVKSTFAQLPKIFELLKDLIPNDDQEKMLGSMKSRWELSGQSSTARRISGDTTPKQVKGIEKQQVKIPSSAEDMLFKPIDSSSEVGKMMHAELYHTARTYSVDRKVGKNVERRVDRPKLKTPSFDFHQIVSVLREYPIMMRSLGLTQHIEFELPGGISNNGKIKCAIAWPAPAVPTTHVTPQVAYRLDTSGAEAYWQFLPRPDSGSELVGPLLCLNDSSHFDVIQVDVDTAALKTLNYTRTIRDRYRKTVGTRSVAHDTSPPTIRGTGLQLIRVNRGLKLAKALIRNAQNWNKLVANTEVTLYADDVMRGFRLDVFDETAGTWQSLMRRNATYKFPLAIGPLKTTGLVVSDEEGVLTSAVTRPVDSDVESSQMQLYAHETVAQWEGWSLVAPPIGSHIGIEDEVSDKKPQKTPAGYAYQVETSSDVVAKSLPRLRFGRKYRLRARFVDVAGNGAKYNELNPLDFTCASDLIKFYRWDPVVSPAIALNAFPIEGESLERMVIRNYNEDADDSVEVVTTEKSTRQFFPPVAAEQTCERHSMFDDAGTGAMKGDVSTYNLIKNNLHDLPTRWFTRGAAGELIPEPTNDTPPATEEKRENAIRYPLVTGGTTEAPYLTDPFSRGLTLQDLPGMAAGELKEITLLGENTATITAATGVVTIVFDDFAVWPAIRSILLRLEEGTTKPTWDSTSRTLSIFLAKGEQAWIRFSSSLGEKQDQASENLKVMGHSTTLTKAGFTASQMAAAGRGLSWLITPWRTLHLMHATQKPLKKPAVKKAAVSVRGFDSTNATIDVAETYVHGKTTQKIDMHAEWDMWEDNLQRKGPELLAQKAVFYEQHVENRLVDFLANIQTQEFGDTKYRKITYTPTATTRFRENFPKAIQSDSSKISRRGDGKELKILSSKRPDGVNLLYIVPSFRWVETEKKLIDNVVTSTRIGGGLRIYMERPWYSSGNEELLGIILYSTAKFSPPSKDAKPKGGLQKMYQQGGAMDAAVTQQYSQLLAGGKLEIPEQVQPYVSQWGMDPIWLSAPTPSDNSPRTNNFRDPKIVLPSVSIEEIDAKQRFSVIGYEPFYDADRQLWYCDVEMDPGMSYYPFVRLGLVRLQPNSLSDAQTGKDVYVSRVTQSEFCQLSPDRKAMARIEEDRTMVTVQVLGNTYRTNITGQQGSEIEVTIEKRDSTANPESDLGWTPVITQRIDRLNAAQMWGGLLKLPASVDSAKHRVVVKEYEQFFSDPLNSKKREVSLGDKKSGDGPIDLTLDKRIVYADVLPLY